MPEKNGNTPNLGASLTALRDSLKTVHPADIHSGVKALTIFMAEQMVIDQPVYIELSLKDEYRTVLETAQGILAWRTQDKAAFLLDLADYAKLLGAVHEWIFFPFATSEHFDEQLQSGNITHDLLTTTLDELDRISVNLGIDAYGYETHRGVHAISVDPLSTYLHETSAQEILRQKSELVLEKFAAETNPVPAPILPGFDRCAQFDETVKGYQAQAVNILRSLSGRVSALVQHCAARITGDSRQDALTFCEKVNNAAEVINAK